MATYLLWEFLNFMKQQVVYLWLMHGLHDHMSPDTSLKVCILESLLKVLNWPRIRRLRCVVDVHCV